ncbi:MAG: hypothetical protein RR775_03380, partial [Massilia sp.]|uniref:hypothetical protein n=1 Tax=Massilia sp. TaxID=1882437 RepID=UPI002FC59926
YKPGTGTQYLFFQKSLHKITPSPPPPPTVFSTGKDSVVRIAVYISEKFQLGREEIRRILFIM